MPENMNSFIAEVESQLGPIYDGMVVLNPEVAGARVVYQRKSSKTPVEVIKKRRKLLDKLLGMLPGSPEPQAVDQNSKFERQVDANNFSKYVAMAWYLDVMQQKNAELVREARTEAVKADAQKINRARMLMMLRVMGERYHHGSPSGAGFFNRLVDVVQGNDTAETGVAPGTASRGMGGEAYIGDRSSFSPSTTGNDAAPTIKYSYNATTHNKTYSFNGNDPAANAYYGIALLVTEQTPFMPDGSARTITINAKTQQRFDYHAIEIAAWNEMIREIDPTAPAMICEKGKHNRKFNDLDTAARTTEINARANALKAEYQDFLATFEKEVSNKKQKDAVQANDAPAILTASKGVQFKFVVGEEPVSLDQKLAPEAQDSIYRKICDIGG